MDITLGHSSSYEYPETTKKAQKNYIKETKPTNKYNDNFVNKRL